MLKSVHITLCLLVSIVMRAQLPALTTTPEQCVGGNASLRFTQQHSSDTVIITWSTGQYNVPYVNNLREGDYNVRVRLKQKKDTVYRSYDSTYVFHIEKIHCPVSVPKYFSPNDDNYNDLLNIGNVSNYPEFDFQVFNKWGQRVHHQSGTFEPWDGKWLGVDLPDGTYYYIFLYKASDGKNVEKGDVTILR